ncbi:MAG: SDR family NAD(P)-dependent oxidoreductase, partial [Pseudomonadota bacterium]|nr:SDR family NAD(P)-dependent oxidoreductase [Pseudomonadota bacterium]
MLRLKDRVSIITGGSQGIGAAYVREFVAEGARVVIADVVPADKLIKKVEGLGSEPLFVKTDVTDEAAVQNMVEKTLNRFGGI